MKILVIGGTGFIGAHLVAKLLSLGHEIIVLSKKKELDSLTTVTFYHGDRKNKNWMENIAKRNNIDIIFDLAGFSEKDSSITYDVFRNKIKQYIFVSSIFVYQHFNSYFIDNKNNDKRINYFQLPISEKHPCNPLKKYGKGKLLSEQFLLNKFKTDGFPVTILRVPPVFGPLFDKRDANSYVRTLISRDFDERRELFYLYRILKGKDILLPNGGYNLIHNIYVDELVYYLTNLLGKKEALGEIFNVASSEPITLRKYVQLLAEGINKKIEIVHLPEKTGKLIFDTPKFYLNFPYSYPFHIVIQTDKIRTLLNGSESKYKLPVSLKRTACWWSNIKELDLLKDYNLGLEEQIIKAVKEMERKTISYLR